MEPRLNNPAALLPGAVQGVQHLLGAARQGGVPGTTLELVHLRASQINGCSYCVDRGWRAARNAGETDERLFAVAAWRESPGFTPAERAALDLAEAATRMADRPDAVPDAVWDAAAAHYDDKGLAALVLTVATANFFNRINGAIRQPAGA